jgi:outer membrane protein assembly factor BamB
MNMARTGLVICGRAFKLLAFLLLIPGIVYGCGSVPAAVPPEIQNNTAEWPSANHDYGNARANMNSTVNSSNVSKLGLAWSVDITGIGEWGGAASNPIIAAGRVYMQDLKSNVYAIDLQKGSLLWKKGYNLDCFGPNGPAIGWDKLFIIKGHYEVAALSLADGRELWSENMSDMQSKGIDIQPTVFNGLVYVSTVPGTSNEDFYTGGGFGTIYALDQNTGNIKWHFDTVDSKDIWGNPRVNSGGGAWFPPAIDVKTGIMYWATANPGPTPGTDEFPSGSSRPGPNLYTNCMIAMDANTGRLIWYKQVKPHDLFDLDFQESPILATINVNGKQTDVVIGSGKLSTVYAFDRKTGDLIWKTPVGLHENDELTQIPAGTTHVSPGPDGGVLTPMALSGGNVFLPMVDSPGDYTPTDFVESTYDITKGKGAMIALDVNSGKPVWTTNFESVDCGAATVVNDLVFTSTLDGTIYALNTKTGDKEWTYRAPGGINGWPAAAGDFILFPVGLGPSPKLLAFKAGAAK